jgi:autotransporter translocation and assembly factor TamB
VRIAGLAKFLNSSAFAISNGIISGDRRIDAEAGKMTVNGMMNIWNARLRKIDLGDPAAVQHDLTDELKADAIAIRESILTLGSMPLKIKGMVNAKPTPAQLELKLWASDVSIAETAKLAAAGMTMPPETSVGGEAAADIQVRGTAEKPSLLGTVSARNAQISGKEIAQPVEVPAMNMALTPAEIRPTTSTSFRAAQPCRHS